METIIAGFVMGTLDGLCTLALGAGVRAVAAYQEARSDRRADWLHDLAWPIGVACGTPLLLYHLSRFSNILNHLDNPDLAVFLVSLIPFTLMTYGVVVMCQRRPKKSS